VDALDKRVGGKDKVVVHVERQNSAVVTNGAQVFGQRRNGGVFAYLFKCAHG
jgi:hypothetical protein